MKFKKVIPVLLVLFFSCQLTKNAQYQYNSRVYDHSGLKPQFLIYNSSRDTSELMFKINTNELLFSRKEDSSSFFSTKISVRYQLFMGLEDGYRIVDSDSTLIETYSDKNRSKYIYGRMKFVAKTNHSYKLKILTNAYNKNEKTKDLLYLEKSFIYFKENILLKANSVELFEPFFKPNQLLSIESATNKGKRIKVSQFTRKFPPSYPPFVENQIEDINFQPKNVYNQFLDSSGFTTITTDSSSMLFIQLDEQYEEGKAVFHFSNYYPDIKSTADMIGPLRYICSNDEYGTITKSVNAKSEIDAFWLARTGNKDRARELIRQFYNRVKIANNQFTSYKEGWKTDRGMVYIIFGEPKNVTIDKGKEVWQYGNSSNYSYLSFVFKNKYNPYSDNVFLVDRDIAYKSQWYKGVETWRSGRAYSAN